MAENVSLTPGTLVRYDGLESGPEFGVVVHSWFNCEISGYDCYVAFFGSAMPSEAPEQKPYVLRYASTLLAVVN